MKVNVTFERKITYNVIIEIDEEDLSEVEDLQGSYVDVETYFGNIIANAGNDSNVLEAESEIDVLVVESEK